MPSDDSPPENPNVALKVREPIFDAPLVVVALVAILIVIHAALSLCSEATQEAIVGRFAFVPGQLTLAFWPERFRDLQAHVNLDPGALQQARIVRDFLLQQGGGLNLWRLLTYAFIHGSWSHVGLNSIWIIAFGPPVARRLGPLRFLALFAATAIAGALFHWAFNMMDFTPLIGASAADSGLMAAAARFMFEPGGPLGGPSGYSRSSPGADYNVPAPPLLQLLRERRVVIFLVIWLATNFIFGAGAQSFGLSEAPVAWLAHIGGFALGLFLFPLFDRRAAPVRR
ncbi:rhomboid family intramembrane serine protease [Methylocapsa sp. S129]|uniref:rhomboid family intramembrane serine protease n=1 Tax=Methylocapsa sp. S129 TaxID=1641869 RepID=UPI00131E8E51|nr:rhomboid family intramembrane serine protease [Methylocapsa sp. S129]